MLIVGGLLAALGFADLLGVVYAWSARDFTRAATVLPAVVGVLFMTLGAQSVLGGFLLAILSGNQAGFLAPAAQARLRVVASSGARKDLRDAA
jgi:hypothetical protein